MADILRRLPPTDERVEQNTPPAINQRLQHSTEERLSDCSGASRQEIMARLDQLDREWDIERVLEVNAGLVIFAGLYLGIRRNRRWLALPAAAAWFLIQHAIQGWCPPVSLFRRLNVRTSKEIGEEKMALRILRGDFATTADPRYALAQARND